MQTQQCHARARARGGGTARRGRTRQFAFDHNIHFSASTASVMLARPPHLLAQQTQAASCASCAGCLLGYRHKRCRLEPPHGRTSRYLCKAPASNPTPAPISGLIRARRGLLAIASTSSAAIFVQQYRESQRRRLVFHQWSARPLLTGRRNEPIILRVQPPSDATDAKGAGPCIFLKRQHNF